MSVMKRFVIKYWWVFPLIFAIISIAFAVAFRMSPSWSVSIVFGLFLLPTTIVLLISWIILLIAKLWGKTLFSFLISVLIAGSLSFPFIYGFAILREHALYRQHYEKIKDYLPFYDEKSQYSFDCGDTIMVIDNTVTN
ncbi:MAG: hypothetical protein IJ197_02075 [Bacteroidaceae bacterium]|nr:hypothetical protein [Bacteroidaceae bacterium]